MIRIAAVAVALLLPFAAVAAPVHDCKELLPNGNPPGYTVAPLQHTELCHWPGYVLSHDDQAHEPRWVAWVVTAEHLAVKNVGRTDDFRADPALPAGASATPADYAKSGYDQGHMSDAEDNGWSADTEHLSFLMSNMIPQCPTCNRQTWRYIENWTRAQTATHPVLYVMSGPVLPAMNMNVFPLRGASNTAGITAADQAALPRPTIGKDHVWVPSASWKLVVDVAGGYAWAFIVPNEEDALKPGSDVTPYLVAPAAIEAATGLVLPLSTGIDRSKAAVLDPLR